MLLNMSVIHGRSMCVALWWRTVIGPFVFDELPAMDCKVWGAPPWGMELVYDGGVGFSLKVI